MIEVEGRWGSKNIQEKFTLLKNFFIKEKILGEVRSLQ